MSINSKPTDQIQQVTVLASSGARSTAELSVHHFSPGERFTRVAIRGIGGLIVTVLLAFVPIAHFVLVPLGLFVTALLTSLALAARAQIRGGTAVCPACNASVTLYGRPYRFPFSDQCEHCRRPLRIELPLSRE